MADEPIMTPADIRERFTDLPEGRYPDEVLEELVAAFEALYRQYRGVWPGLRTCDLERDVDAFDCSVQISEPLVDSITSVTVDGIAVTGTQTFDATTGRLSYVPGFGRGLLAVAFVAGYAETPVAVLRACRLFVRHEAKADANPNTGNSYMTTNESGLVERASTADFEAGRPTGWLDVDRALNAMRDFRLVGLG